VFYADSKHYRAYLAATAAGNRDAAAEALRNCLENEEGLDQLSRASLSRMLADLALDAEDSESMRKWLRSAEASDPSSFSNCYFLGTFYEARLAESEHGLFLAERALELLNSDSGVPAEEARQWKQMIHGLRGRCLASLRRYDDAAASLSLLAEFAEFSTKPVFEHVIELCEALVEMESYRELARIHARYLAAWLGENEGSEYEPLIRRLQAMAER